MRRLDAGNVVEDAPLKAADLRQRAQRQPPRGAAGLLVPDHGTPIAEEAGAPVTGIAAAPSSSSLIV
jgi:hypothetical protein